jgi:hypothetical protein
MKEIDKVKAYCVINEVTMQQVSQFYRRKGDAVRWINDATKFDGVFAEEYKAKWRYCVAEFVFDKYYVLE